MRKFKCEYKDNHGMWGSYTTLQIIHNDTVIEEYADGGEPEDNSFGRDWNWVAQAIENAYRLGYSDGKKYVKAKNSTK